jgi:hypothetical protein
MLLRRVNSGSVQAFKLQGVRVRSCEGRARMRLPDCRPRQGRGKAEDIDLRYHGARLIMLP